MKALKNRLHNFKFIFKKSKQKRNKRVHHMNKILFFYKEKMKT